MVRGGQTEQVGPSVPLICNGASGGHPHALVVKLYDVEPGQVSHFIEASLK